MVSKEYAIKRLFARKHNIDASEVKIVINKESGSYLRGTFQLLADSLSNEIDNSGTFLAVQVGPNWVLVFSGKGVASCEKVKKYNFPENMIGDCYTAQSMQVIENKTIFIILEITPESGYKWDVDFDSDYLRLMDRKYILRSQESGPEKRDQESFKFVSLKPGQTQVMFSYLPVLEENKIPSETKAYKITIVKEQKKSEGSSE